MEFGFFRGLPENLFILDIVGQVAFLVDIALQFFVAFRDSQTYRIVHKRTPIALRSHSTTFLSRNCSLDKSFIYICIYVQVLEIDFFG